MTLRHLLAVGALLLLPATGHAQAARLRVPFTLDTLPNGLTLIVHEDHSVPIVTTNVWFHVGSGDEKTGRTGFAHLFEHLMFMGSEHAPYPQFDRLLEAAGANNNGSTTEDRTNYYEAGPSSALRLMLWLEADRMGWLLPTMDKPKVDLQRDVVKNERRQSYENQPYGMVADVLPKLMYPAGHPYSWPVIGSMADLSAASVDDVKDFFRRYYAPNNATLVVAGDVKPDSVRAIVREYFRDIPRGPAIERPAPAAFTVRDTAATLEDRVQLARLYLNWHTVKNTAADAPALQVAAYMLAGSRTSRLTQALVYNGEIATTVQAYHDGKRLDGDFAIVATARPGRALDTLQTVIDQNLQRHAGEGPTARELDQARNAIEASFLRSIQTVGGKADQLNEYYYQTGNPDGFQDDLDKLRAVSASDIQRVVRTYLQAPRVMVSVVPQGKQNLAATQRKVTP
ncbi:MAG TPA: pitrilysin family protein [Gemmatimonadaceae bacterium]|nr:pitrilysin family protein [Gemmatimonadaceae bacterium]